MIAFLVHDPVLRANMKEAMQPGAALVIGPNQSLGGVRLYSLVIVDSAPPRYKESQIERERYEQWFRETLPTRLVQNSTVYSVPEGKFLSL